MAFVAFRDDQSELIGVARLEADPDYVSAEYAVIVRSDLEGRRARLGILMRHLIRYAESEGLRDLHGDVLAANVRMLQMCLLRSASTSPSIQRIWRCARCG